MIGFTMNILTREEARRHGEPKYFTGIPCKNGHVTYRYTQSGTCSACIRSYSSSPETLQQDQRRRDNLSRLVTFRARVADIDQSFISEMVLASVRMREPGALMRDVRKGGAGRGRVDRSSVHEFHCFAEDLEQLRTAAGLIFDSRCVRIQDLPSYKPPAEEWPEGDPK